MWGAEIIAGTVGVVEANRGGCNAFWDSFGTLARYKSWGIVRTGAGQNQQKALQNLP